MTAHDDFRRRYLTEPMIAGIVDTMVVALRECNVTPHDLARCAVLAATLYAERYQAPLVIVTRGQMSGEFVLTDADIKRLLDARSDGGS